MSPCPSTQTPNGDGVTVYHLMLRAGPDERSQEGVLWILGRIGAEEAKTPIKVRGLAGRWVSGPVGMLHGTLGTAIGTRPVSTPTYTAHCLIGIYAGT